jgi:two-component system cell cycle response regulator DivK
MPSTFDPQASPPRLSPHQALPVCPVIPNLTARPRRPRRPLILLVDDNLDARTMYGFCLEFEGFAYMTARDGQEAIARIRDRRPALILMDAAMPGMDGWEATRRIKADAGTRDIPLYMLTAHAFAEDRRRAVEVGADGFLTKPILPDALVREIRRALNLPESPGGELS